MYRRTSITLFTVLIALVLTSCGTASAPIAAPAATDTAAPAPQAAADTSVPEPVTQAAPTEADASTPVPQEKIALKVGATIVPAGEILEFVRDNLAEEAGLDLEIVEFADYVQPNLVLRDKQIDANLFQHRPYMHDFGEQHNIALKDVVPAYFVRFGLYSKNVTSLADVPEGGVVAVPNDVTNVGRALRLLEENGLITINPAATGFIGLLDIVDNPKNLQFIELEAPQLPRSLDDTAVSAINGNFAIQAGLKPNEDALALEEDVGPLAVVLTVLEGDEEKPGVQILARLLHDPRVGEFINEKYQGAVVWVTEDEYSASR